MTQLAACYFCGTALDDPVDDYPVVPESLRASDADPTTVSLCSACHEKLDAVVGEIGDALQTADSSPVEPTDDADDVLVEPDGDPDASDDAPTTGAASPPGTDGEVNAVPDPRPADETASQPDEEAASGGAEPTTGATDAGETADASAQTDEDGGDAAERSVVEGKHDISALEYNKVMRLLQNREFPVDREEIEVVAANAYQVGRADCAKVIDVAVDRGLIAEEDGQLRKPEDA